MTEEEKQILIEEFKKELEENKNEIDERRANLIRETGHSLPKSRRDYLRRASEIHLNNLYKKKTLHLLVDIDGVISPLNSFEGDYIEVKGNYCNWAIRPEVANWLEDVQSKVKFVWGSSWEEQSNLIFDKLEIPAAEYISFDEADPDSRWLKMHGYLSYLAKMTIKDTVIIIDDEIPDFDKQLLENKGIKIVKPEKTFGLTDNDLLEVNLFIENFRNLNKTKRKK